MEIAELSSTEKSAVAEHAESLAHPETPEAAFKEFASKVIGARKAEQKDERPRPEGKPFDLGNTKLDSPEYKEWARSGKVSLKAEPKTESSESQSDARETAKEGDFIDVRAEAEPRIRTLTERAWTEQQLTGKDHDDFVAHVNKQAQVGVDYITNHKQAEHIQSGLRNMFAGLPQAEAMYRDFTAAILETKCPGEILAHVGLTKSDRDVFRTISSTRHMRDAVHWLAKELLRKAGSAKAAAKPEERRPRAPKPMSEVGGRNYIPERADLAAARAGDFKAFDSAMREKYRASR